MNLLLEAGAALSPVACGYALWSRLGPARATSRLECAAHALPIGVVLVAMELLIFSRYGGYDRLALVWPLAVLALACMVWPLAAVAPRAAERDGNGIGLAGRVALALIVAELVLVLWDIAAAPRLLDWDSWAIWGLKAKAFFVDRNVGIYLARGEQYQFSWPARPCLTSLFGAFLYTCAGRVDEALARLAHVALASCAALVLYADLRRRWRADTALIWTAVLVTIPNLTYQSSAGVANVVLGLYLFAALAALDRWSASPEAGALVGPGLLLAGACLTRDEGACLAGLVVLGSFLIGMPGALRSNRRVAAGSAAVLLLGSAAVYRLWSGLVGQYGLWDIRSTWLDAEVPARLWSHLHDVPAILREVLAELASPGAQQRASPLEQHLGLALFWPLFVLASLGLGRLRRTDPLGLRCALVAWGGLLMYTLGFMAFPYQDLGDLVNNWMFVLDRHALALVPLAVRAMASVFSQSLPAASGQPTERASLF